MLKAQNAPPEQIKAARAKCRETSQQIDDFCEQTGRTRHRDREAVYTKREFPAKDTYDASTFTRERQERQAEYFRNGGAQQSYTFGQMKPYAQAPTPTPATPTEPATVTQATPNPEVSTFNPAKTIEEAEKYARETFVDTDMWASHGLSLKGISVESANIVNERLSDFYSTYKVEKFSSLIAPAANTKLGKAIKGAHAGFNPVNRAMLLNKASLKNPAGVAKALAEEKGLVKDYLSDPGKYPGIKGQLKRILDASRTSGRATVADTLEEIIDHECGHALEKALRNVSNYDTIVANMGNYAGSISGYAQETFHEYIAESYCAWRKGEAIDPELVNGFLELRR